MTDSHSKDWAFETLAVQSAIPRGLGETIGFPIHAAAAFQFNTLEEAREEFINNEGLSYTRIQNPTVRLLEERISVLEGSSDTLCLGSGQAATFTAIMSVCRAGDHIVASASLFGGSTGILTNILPLMGISTTFVNGSSESVKAAMQENTRLVWSEMISNPAGRVPDLAALAEVAHEQGAMLIIDNTCAGAGYLCQPLEQGADMVTASLTKWAGGHGTVMGGSISIRPDVDLSQNPIYIEGAEKSLLKQRGQEALSWRLRWFGASQLGMVLSPHSAFLVAQGLETLAFRLKRESETALELAKWLKAHSQIKAVSYPGLVDHPSHQNAQRYLQNGFGAMMTFDVEQPSDFLAKLKILRIAPNLGDVRTLVVHPWTTTHSKISEEARYAAGVTPNTIRMCVGIEEKEDLKADIEQAL